MHLLQHLLLSVTMEMQVIANDIKSIQLITIYVQNFNINFLQADCVRNLKIERLTMSGGGWMKL